MRVKLLKELNKVEVSLELTGGVQNRRSSVVVGVHRPALSSTKDGIYTPAVGSVLGAHS